jgi:hypothetical protein
MYTLLTTIIMPIWVRNEDGTLRDHRDGEDKNWIERSKQLNLTVVKLKAAFEP